jgi:pantothenate kinase
MIELTGLIERARGLVQPGRRTLLGLCGGPGAGKSTLARQLVDAVGANAVVVAMDGYHLADQVLVQLGRRERKGAPDTFDRSGFGAALGRIRLAQETVYLPRFHRDIEDSIAGEIVVGPTVELVVVEGNYLLLWPEVRNLLDECWYLAPPEGVRVERLARRHAEFGKSPADALARAAGQDQHNADVIADTRAHADLQIELA